MYRLMITPTLLLLSSIALAHGDDKPGPNGGFIKMPGAFHTEVVPVDKTKLKIFLLDFDWKNPVVKDSNVSVTHNHKTLSTAKCEVQETYFACEFPKAVDLGRKGGKLTIDSRRANQKGNTVVYQLPLAFAQAPGTTPGTTPSAPDHSGH